MKAGYYDVARSYIKYRRNKEILRKSNTTDAAILSLISLENEEIKQENSNKNPTINSVQRDYIAGEVSKDITKRYLLPSDIIQAHEEGLIHFHDADYFIQKLHNCDLINLEDMLQNGTVISEVMIEKPHSFSTACTIATQIIAQVASSQYGGQSISLAHLAPFVDVSRKKIQKEVEEELNLLPDDELSIKENHIKSIVEERLIKEIRKGIQTIQYQTVTLQTTNGQAPFITVYMYLNEAKNEQEKADLALIIEEVLNQRIQGVKNEKGVWITPAFPKLIYVLEEDNISEEQPYWYLTELAAKCTAKRMVPDYISEKVMRELKGDVYTCMGCVDGKEVVTYKLYNALYVESFERMWERLSNSYEVRIQDNQRDEYIDLEHVQIFDMQEGFVNTYRIIRNHSENWLKVTTSNGRCISCTTDHPFVTQRGRVLANQLILGDKLPIIFSQYSCAKKMINPNIAWAYGVLLCDAAISSNIVASFALKHEDDIICNLRDIIKDNYNIDSKIVERHRDKKGNYKDVVFIKATKLKYELISKFEGISKNDRHIPNEIFSCDVNVRYAFLAGMIDADGYINNKNVSTVQLGSVNKELAIQQMLLAQSLGMKSRLYENYYNKDKPNAVRYRVEFIIDDLLARKIKCEKKKLNIKNTARKRYSILDEDYGIVTKIEPLNIKEYSYDVTTESDHFDVSGINSHNCRSFLTPDRFNNRVGNIANALNYEKGKHKYYGRFNQGVVTVNLVDIALTAKKKSNSLNLNEKFKEVFRERMELCHRALRCRHERLLGTLSDVSPILWQYGALARLEKGEKIDKLLYDGYSTISLGYAGLWECVYALTGKKLTEPDGQEKGLQIMQMLNDYTNKWKEQENIDYSLYGTPLETTTYKFAKCLKNRFGIIKGVTDKNYITNSYHIHVTENINAFDKLSIEAKFQELSPGGAISYVEVPNMQNNIPAVLQVIKHIYNNIMYAELNTKSDYCQVCGYDGEIEIVEDENGKLIWKCPKCGNTDQDQMNVARRTCGLTNKSTLNRLNCGKLLRA